jgi:hypothetical protein
MGNLDHFDWDADERIKRSKTTSTPTSKDWEDRFFAEFHRFPDDDDELEEFMRDHEEYEQEEEEEEEEYDPWGTGRTENLNSDPIESIIRNGDKQVDRFKKETSEYRGELPQLKKSIKTIEIPQKSVKFVPPSEETEEDDNSWNRRTESPRKARSSRGLNFRVQDL